jgi:hypothetical protein
VARHGRNGYRAQVSAVQPADGCGCATAGDGGERALRSHQSLLFAALTAVCSVSSAHREYAAVQAAGDEPPPRLLERRTASACSAVVHAPVAIARCRRNAVAATLSPQRCRRNAVAATLSPQRCRRNAVAATLSPHAVAAMLPIGATVTAACVVL